MKEEWSQGQAEAEAKEAQALVMVADQNRVSVEQRGMKYIIDETKLFVPNFILLSTVFQYHLEMLSYHMVWVRNS